MNTEKLLSLCVQIQNEINQTQLATKMANLIANLQTVVSNQHPSHVTNFNSAVQEFINSEKQSIISGLSSYDKGILIDLGIQGYIGSNVYASVRNILGQNSLTHQIALNELTPINNEIQRIYSGISSTINGFSQLKITSYDDAEQSEMSVMIPRILVSENIETLANEFKEVGYILRPFVEICDSSISESKVRQISSSEFIVTLALITPVAQTLVKVIDKIFEWFERAVNIKKSLKELRDNGIDEHDIKPIMEKKTKEFEQLVEQIVNEVLKEHGKEATGRNNELKNMLVKSVKKLASRIDKGFAFDISIPHIKNDEDEQKATEYEEIRTIASKIRRLSYSGTDLLLIEEQTEETISKKKVPNNHSI